MLTDSLNLLMVLALAHFEHCRFRAGFCLVPRQLKAKQSSSVISAHNDCRFLTIFNGSVKLSCFDLIQNSMMEISTANARPHNKTTNTPPMLSTPSAKCPFALLSLALSWRMHVSPGFFHHLSYSI